MPACSRTNRGAATRPSRSSRGASRWCPTTPTAHSNLGIVLQAHGRLDEAIVAYRRAIALDPGHANAHSNLGVLLRATGKPVEAEAAYRTAIRLDPDHIDAYTNLGILLNGLKRHARKPSRASAR